MTEATLKALREEWNMKYADWDWLVSRLHTIEENARKEEKKKRHNWVINKGLSKYAYCEKCGYMMKYKNNDWDCPGMAKITFRNDNSLSSEMEEK